MQRIDAQIYSKLDTIRQLYSPLIGQIHHDQFLAYVRTSIRQALSRRTVGGAQADAAEAAEMERLVSCHLPPEKRLEHHAVTERIVLSTSNKCLCRFPQRGFAIFGRVY